MGGVAQTVTDRPRRRMNPLADGMRRLAGAMADGAGGYMRRVANGAVRGMQSLLRVGAGRLLGENRSGQQAATAKDKSGAHARSYQCAAVSAN